MRIHLVALVLIAGAGCGKDKDEKERSGKGGAVGGGGGEVKKITGTTTCAETQDLAIVLGGQPFEAKDATAVTTGMVDYSQKTVTRNVNVAITNYDAGVGFLGATMPDKPGQTAVMLQFVSDRAPAGPDDGKAAYATLTLAPGDYPPSMADHAHLLVWVMDGSPSGEPFGESTQDPTGTATITTFARDRICGKVDLTSPKGTIKGTFNVAIEGDLWDR